VPPRTYTAELLDRVFELLELCFPGAGLEEQERAARKLGMHWDEISTPFVHFDGDDLVTHVGVLELPMVLEGRLRTVGGVHAVSTHPGQRRRGHYRAVMEDLLEWCDARYEILQLSTAQPELYEPFGFRVVPECRFVGQAPAPAGSSPAWVRELDLSDSVDLRTLRSLLSERAPVSSVLGVAGGESVFLFDEARRPLHYAQDLDSVFSLERDGATLRLYDVVARAAIPALADIVRRVPPPVERVEVYFTPDRLDADLTPEPHVLDGDEHFMVRGPYPPEGQPLMLPRTARH